ncbi:unnamed protein product [Knipowitschia caucasica]|uniref:SOGA coiled-coil domain-containing protein n=1 Tax=Knipowitschia caucasica TaxID=637954 RepID=A0AAV2M078_KNICA
MNTERGKRSASRNLKPQKTQPGVQKKKIEKECVKQDSSMAPHGKHQGKVSPPSPTTETVLAMVPAEHRRLSDASNTSEDLSNTSGDLSNTSGDLSKDSGCASMKLSSSDSDTELSWMDGRAYESPDSEGKEEKAPPEAPHKGWLRSPGAYMEMIIGETSEDLNREVEDLRSENEYLKDELEELRCEMFEIRDLFQEEEVYQIQQLRLQLDQANKTCRILQYRLRKAERRSIRVAQTGQVDGELVRSLEHDIKVAKSASLRLYNELEAVQKKNLQLEWENEALREKTQELEVAKQVLQAEAEKAKESSVKKKSIRSSAGKAERRLSQMEDDSADLRCQLHFTKEELSLMCKKLTKLVSDNEAMQSELIKYHTAYGHIHTSPLPEGQHNSARAREAEVKNHLKLVEEEATLLSRRIVELEVENRGLRAEMSDLREKTGAGMDEEEAENASLQERDQGKEETSKEQSAADMTQMPEGNIFTCDITREGPVGGEWDPSDTQESCHKHNQHNGFKVMSQKDYKTLAALRDHSYFLSSSIQLLMAPSEDREGNEPEKGHFPLNEALELCQTMLLAFIRRAEAVLMEGDSEGLVWQPSTLALPSGDTAGDIQKSQSKQECVEDLRTAAVKERAKQSEQAAHTQSCRDSKMQQCLQILWLMHQWCQEENERPSQNTSELGGLLRDVAAQILDEPLRESTESRESRARRGKAEERVASCVFDSELPVSPRAHVSTGTRRYLSLHNKRKKNWCYTNQEAAHLDREDPVKTWDHLIMPLNFPGLDFQQMSTERSNTAPEKTAVRIYYSPPSRRRVALAQLKQSPMAEADSPSATSPWFTPPTSFSALALDSNLSDDMKEITAGLREKWVNTASSGTQTQLKPLLVSVAMQTDVSHGSVSFRSPNRIINSPVSSPLPVSGAAAVGRTERPRSANSSPKLRRNSSIPSQPSSRDRAMWNLAQQHATGMTWKGGQRVAVVNVEQTAKPASKPAQSSTNKCGLVTEFLRRVSGRADKPAQGYGLRSKSGGPLKNLERVPTRPVGVPLQRSDSVTRIVNQRFMKPREEKTQGARPNPVPGEEGNYDCVSGGSLSFCFSRPTRSSLRQTIHQSKVQQRRHTQPSCA